MAITEQIIRLQSAKIGIKTAIELKGVTVPETATLDAYGTYIAQIKTQGLYQAKTVIPSAGGETVTPDDGFEALSSVIVTGDANLVPSNIKKDVAIFGVVGTLQEGTGGGGDTPGGGGGGGTNTSLILPMPVTALSITQQVGKRGQLSLSMAVPKNVKGVDILVKKDYYPDNIGDYFQKVTIPEGENTIDLVLQPNEDGNYQRAYGIFAVTRNEAGTQTAISGSNRKLYEVLYGRDVKEVVYNGSVTNYSSYAIAGACTRKFGNLVFIGNATTSKDTGLYVLNLDTQEIKQVTTLNTKYIHYIDLGDNYFMIGTESGTNASKTFIYNYNDNEFNSISSKGGFNFACRDGDTIICRTALDNAGWTKGWNTNSHTIEDYGTDGVDILETPYGVFAFQRYSAGTTKSSVKLFNGNGFSDCTVQTINTDENTDVEFNEPFVLKHSSTCQLFLDTHGNLYLKADKVYQYNGRGNFREVKYNNGWTLGNIFKMANEYYYISSFYLYKFAGDGIQSVMKVGNRGSVSTAIVYETEYGCLYFPKGSTDNGYYYFEVFDLDNLKATKLGTYTSSSNVFEFNDKYYFAGSSNTNVCYYEETVNEETGELTSGFVIKTILAKNLASGLGITEINGNLYSIPNGTDIYRIYEDDTTKLLYTETVTDAKRCSVYGFSSDGKTYFARVPNTGYGISDTYMKYCYVYEYNPETEEFTKESTPTSGIVLAVNRHFRPAVSTVYAVNEDSQKVSINSVNFWNSYLEKSNSSNFFLAGSATANQMRIVYVD